MGSAQIVRSQTIAVLARAGSLLSRSFDDDEREPDTADTRRLDERDDGAVPGVPHVDRIPRLDRERDLSGLRPEIPLSDLTADCLDRLLALIDHWITDARAHAAEPEATTET